MLEAAVQAMHTGAQELRLAETYDLSVQENDGWTAVGMMPRSALNNINYSVVRTGVVVSFAALALSSAAANHCYPQNDPPDEFACEQHG